MVKVKNKKWLFSIATTAILIIIVFLAWPSQSTTQLKNKDTQSSVTSPNTVNNPKVFDKNQFSTDEASSIWVVVNKGRVLPDSYTPAELTVPNVPLRLSSSSSEMHVRGDTAAALEKMIAAAKQNGINLMLGSGYRSYSNQAATYAGFVRTSGAAAADTFSARPGHSEHQTGLAADIEPNNRTCEFEECFASTPEGQWLAANCYNFGFIIRYQKDAQSLTGYEYEPWHVRFVGNGLASQLHSNGQTLEQYFSLPIYPNYPTVNYEIKNI